MEEDGRAALGSRLRGARERVGLTQRLAASRAGVSASYLAQLELGRRNAPSRRVLARLARVYGLAPEALWEESMGGGAARSGENAARVAWAYGALLRDPSLVSAGRLRGLSLPVDVQALLVELYQAWRGRRLLGPEELAGEERADGE